MRKEKTFWERRAADARRILKKAPSALRNAPLFALTGVVSLSIEAYAMGGIWASNTSEVVIVGHTFRLAFAEMAMSASMTLMALALAGAAAAQKADPRKDQRDRAGWTQLLAIAVLAGPIFYAANCNGMIAQREESRAYIGSDQHRADIRNSTDRSLDSATIAEATDRLAKAQPVTKADEAHLIPSLAWIGIILGLNMAAVRCGWRAEPETKTQRARRTTPAGLTSIAGGKA